MNNPLDYEPHPLCIQACREVQEMLARREDWQEEIARGKMFGVLIFLLLKALSGVYTFIPSQGSALIYLPSHKP